MTCALVMQVWPTKSGRCKHCMLRQRGCCTGDQVYVQVQVVIGVGLLAAVSYAVKQYVAPKVSQWYHEWRHDADKAKAEDEQQKTAQLVANAIQSQVSLVHCLEGYTASCTPHSHTCTLGIHCVSGTWLTGISCPCVAVKWVIMFGNQAGILLVHGALINRRLWETQGVCLTVYACWPDRKRVLLADS